MDKLYVNIMGRAREIARKYPAPAFYEDFSQAVHLSREFFRTDPVIARLHGLVAEKVDNDLGHGLDHAVKVTIDAGALFLIQAERWDLAAMEIDRGLLLVQCAGLLHDIRRKEKQHARAGARAARRILAGYPLSENETSMICLAIQNHEAFKTPESCPTPLGQAISDCLYDADKFRWGPDNFTDTVWCMIAFFKAPVAVFLERYPEGVKGVRRIKKTFRTKTGKKYGPGFVDAGLLIGEDICRMLRDEFV